MLCLTMAAVVPLELLVRRLLPAGIRQAHNHATAGGTDHGAGMVWIVTVLGVGNLAMHLAMSCILAVSGVLVLMMTQPFGPVLAHVRCMRSAA